MNNDFQSRALRLSPGSSSEAGAGTRKPRRPLRKILLLAAGAVVVVVALGVVFAPAIASSVAPGKIESAAKESIKGSVKVGAIHLGWFSPTEVEGLSIVDPEGKVCATVSVKSAATLWKVVSERWWSATRLDVGETEMSGVLDLVRDEATGVTNLQRALEPRVAAAAGAKGGSAGGSGGGGGGGLESVKGSLKITKLDATVKDKDAKGVLGPEQGVKGLKGTVSVDYAASPASIAAKADLTGLPVGSGSDAGAMTVKADVGVKPKGGTKGGLESFACKLDVAGAPVGIVDALAKQGGAMVGALGQRADVKLDASGTPSAAKAKFVLASTGAHADLDLALQDGVLSSVGPPSTSTTMAENSGKVSVASTEFLASMPALRDALARAGAQVKLDKAPGLEITIDKLRWPLPQGLLDGTGGSAAMAAADFRGAGLVLRVHVDAMGGKVAMNAPTSPASPAGSGAATNAEWKTFAVQPIDLTVQAEDLSKPLSVTGGTRATLDGSAAGDVSLTASASGLLDAAGKLRALNKNGIADDVSAEVKVNGMSTALLQPVVAGSGVALDLRQDVGPTLNLSLKAKADVKGFDSSKAGATPPIDATVMVDSQNLKVDGAVRSAGGVVSTTGDGVKVTMGTAVPLVQRMMSKPGVPSAIEVSGTGGVVVTVKDFSAPMDKLSRGGAEILAAVKAAITAEVTSLGVKPTGVAAEQPVQVGKATVHVMLDGANPPRADVNAGLSHAGTPFEMVGDVRLDGITGGKLPKSAAGAAQVIALKPTGTLEARNVPRSVANLVPSATMAGTGALSGDDAMTQISRALRESIGSTATVAFATKPDGAAQAATIKVTTANGGIGADSAAKMTEKDITVSTLSAAVGMDPKIVNPVLASQSGARSGTKAAAPMSLAKAFVLSVKSGGAITVPLKAGTFEPDFAGASDATIALATDNDIAIDNVPIGEDASGAAKTTGVRVSGLKMNVKAPLSGLAPGGASKRMNATFSALAQRSASGNAGGDKAATIADVSGTVTAGMDGSTPDANVKLASIDTAVVENLIDKPGVLTGGLGETAEATLRVQPQTGGQAVSIALTAPKVTDAKIDLFQSADKLAITKPAVITWKPDAVFLNKTLFAAPVAQAAAPASTPSSSGLGGVVRKLTGEAPSQPATPAPSSSVKVAQVSPVTISISKFAMATTVTRDGQVVSGPLKPGVFELEASVGVSSVGLAVTQGAAAATAVTLDGITAKVTHTPASGAFGEIVAVLGIDKVSGGAAAAPAAGAGTAGAAAKKTGATVRIANLADARGVLTTNAAVVNLDADLVSFPTAIIDSLANQKGVLAELLGPTVDVQAKGTNVSAGGGDMKKASGAVQVKMTSTRASAEINGDIKDGAFVQSGAINARIMAITPDLVKMLAGALPVVETIEKKPSDQPGSGDAKGFMVPVDGDLTKLNGDLTIDPGVARFTTKSIFGDFIKAFGGKTEGALGQKIEPFVVHANKGVLTYDKFKLPAGQFAVETRGTVDLVKRQIDIVTYAPAGALTERALGKITEQIPAQLRGFLQDASIPFVTKGPLDSYSTSPDFGLLVKELGEKIKKEPGKIIGDLLGDVLKPKPKPGK